MNTITINTDRKFNSTVVPNLFIDHYMPAANGSYVKVYLYLLRCLSGDGKTFSLSLASDAIDESEKDILRALSYWEKCHVLSLHHNGEELSGITLLELTQDATASDTGDTGKSCGTLISLEQHRKEVQAEAEKITAPARHVYSTEQLAAFRKRSEISFVLNAVELYLERLLTEQDINLVIYLLEDLHFSTDLILHLYEYCVERNKKKWEYIEKVALTWHSEGIDTVAKAQEHSLIYDACFNAVNKGFSLGRLPLGPEREYIKKWSTYHLPSEVIEEACSRTILNIGKQDFKYLDRILKDWHSLGVTSLADVRTLDATHAAKAKTDTTAPRSIAPVTKSAASYNSYTQRQYTSEEYAELERRLLKQM